MAIGTDMSDETDLLTEDGSASNLVITHFGDPAFALRDRRKQAIDNFLRSISYLLYADKIAIPARFVMDADGMAEAARWSTPLLQGGLVVVERRAGPESFVDVARERGVPEVGIRRAEFLDAAAKSVRRFKYSDLGATYVDILRSDLAPEGAFRRIVPGGIRGGAVDTLNRAMEIFERDGNFNPESFARALQEVDPRLHVPGLRWAMARYYTTPLQFDRSNTRQLPEQAARMLIKGGVLDPGPEERDTPAPIENALERLQRLQVELPLMGVSERPEAYCEALINVRDRVPEARSLFSEVRDRATLVEASLTLSDEFQRELQKQLAVRTVPGVKFDWVSTLASGSVGAAAGLAAASTPVGAGVGAQIGIGAGSAAAGFAATLGAKATTAKRRARNDAPWLLAIDSLEKALKGKRSR